MSGKIAKSPASPFQWQPEQPEQPGPGPLAGSKPTEPTENQWAIDVPGLSRRQQSALPTVFAAPTIVEAARRSGVGESTLRRWLDDPRFRHALDRLREEAYSVALKQVQALVPECLNIFARIAVESADPVLRKRAARYLLDYGLKFKEAEELRHRLSALEQALEADKSANPSFRPSPTRRPTTSPSRLGAKSAHRPPNRRK